MTDSGDNFENRNPRATSNIFSSISYFWTLPLFKTAFARDLETSDVYTPLDEHSSARLGDKFSQYWKNELVSGNPSLFRVLYSSFKWHATVFFLLTLILECGIRIFQPIILGKFIQYFSHIYGSEQMTGGQLYLYGLALIMCCVLAVIMSQSIAMGIVHMGLKIKIGCSSLIYRKSLRLSKSSLGDATIGHISNLMTNDVSRLELFVGLMNYLIIGPIQTIVITVCLWYYLGISSLVGVALLLLTIPFSSWLGISVTKYRKRGIYKTDERIQKISEAISGIKTIKMFAWDDFFISKINKLRNKEMEWIGKTNYIKGAMVSLDMILSRLSLFASILCYVLLENNISAEKVFVVASFYGLLKQSMTVFFPRAILLLADFLVSMKRLQSYMLYEENTKSVTDTANRKKFFFTLPKYEIIDNNDSTDELTVPLHIGNNVREIKVNVSQDNLDDLKDDNESENPESPRFKNPNALSLEQVFAKWNQQSSELVINNVTMNIKHGSFVAIIGEVGSGKSTLLNLLLEELSVSSGLIDIHGDLSYASQDPWVFNGSVKKNILFGSKMDKLRYKNVIDCCALKRDLMTFANGDKYEVQEFGSNLSGGQRVRINLARAVYRNVDIYLLDDPLSAVDVHVGRTIFDSCLCKFLHGRTRVLVTHQTHYLQEVDHLILMQNGSIVSEGTYDYLIANSKEFSKFIQLSKNEESVVNDNLDKLMSRRKEQKMMVKLTSIDSEVLPDELPNNKKYQTEKMSSGGVESYVYKAYMMASGSIFFVICVLFLAIAAQFFATMSDYWTCHWVNEEQTYAKYCQNLSETSNHTSSVDFIDDSTQPSLLISTMINNSIVSSDLMDVTINDQGPNFNTETDYLELCQEGLDRGLFLRTYGILIMLVIGFVVVRSFSFFWVLIRSSLKLHYSMLESIIRAQIRFFTQNPSGRILNRFSKDMANVDDVLPQKLMDAMQNILQVCGVLLLAIYINWWLIFAVMFSIGLFIVLRMYYIPTSRSIYRLMGTTRSPGLSHSNASLKGIATIRAFGSQRQLEREFDALQSVHSSTCYLNLATGRAFALWADSVCLLLIIFSTWIFILCRDTSTGGNVGLLLSQVIGLTTLLQYGLRMSSEVENEMISVERILDYTDIELEPPAIEDRDYQLPTLWPPFGEIKFNNVWVRYSPTRNPAISDLDLLIEPSQRIGIVGRTGAGKSSIINALFRLPFMDGYIELDGIRTDTLGLQVLRSKISVIPQEPVLFTGTVRSNLDPFNAYPDYEVWNALEKVELKEKIFEFGGLDIFVSADGNNFSVGQRQLLCLARALLKQNRILILDEATANVDQRTDDLIQKTIRTDFKDSTVLIIAHRMDIVIDCHKVLVMDGGKKVEYDHPHILLQNDSFFTSMVAKTGMEKEQKLRSLAKKHFDELKKTRGISDELPPVKAV